MFGLLPIYRLFILWLEKLDFDAILLGFFFVGFCLPSNDLSFEDKIPNGTLPVATQSTISYLFVHFEFSAVYCCPSSNNMCEWTLLDSITNNRLMKPRQLNNCWTRHTIYKKKIKNKNQQTIRHGFIYRKLVSRSLLLFQSLFSLWREEEKNSLRNCYFIDVSFVA